MGNAILPPVLREAGAEDADLLISTAAMDATDLVGCRVAKQVFNVRKRIVRLRPTELTASEGLTGLDGFCADYVISPEESVTQAIVRLIEYPEALQVIEFGDGRLALVAARAYEHGKLTDCPVKDLQKHVPDIEARIVAIFRNDRPISLNGETRI